MSMHQFRRCGMYHLNSDLAASSSLSRTSGRTKLSSNSRMKGSTPAISKSLPILVLQTPTSARPYCLQRTFPSYSIPLQGGTSANRIHPHSSTSTKQVRSRHTCKRCGPIGSSELVGPFSLESNCFPDDRMF